MMRIAVVGVLLACAGLSPSAVADETMQAVRFAEFGPVEVLAVEQVPRPIPAADELLVRVYAAAVNPVDSHIRAGHARGFLDVDLPHIPGLDISGTVAAIGTDVDGFGVGDEVFAMLELTQGGGYAEYVAVKASAAAAKPDRLSHVEAAALPLVSLTAWQALFDTANLSSGQTVLIHGGSGGVGSVAIQLAKSRGARILATASAGNLDFVRGLGADVAIDYRSERFEEIAQDVDVVLDLIGGQTQERSLSVLKDGGVLVSLVGLGAAAQTAPRNIKANAILVRPDGAQLRQIAALADAGSLRPEVSLRLPLTRIGEAHTQIATGHTRGKIVLELAGSNSTVPQ